MFTSTGNVLVGHSVSSYKFQGVTTLAQIEAYGLQRPTEIDKSKRGMSKQQQESHSLHNVINRTFDSKRKENAESYSGYIEAVEIHGRPGGTPAITLFNSEELEETDGGIVIPYGQVLVAIDGETQTEARFLLADRLPETRNNVIAVTLYHGISVEQARQILHDYNTKGLPWSETKAARFNHTGQLSVAVEQAIASSGISKDRINYRSATVTKKTVISNQQILTAFAGYQLNGQGSQMNVSAGHFKRFNDSSAVSVPPTAVQHIASLIAKADTDPTLGKAHGSVWQIAGVLLSKNLQPSQLNWGAAIQAYEQTKSSGRGGPRRPVKERLAAIEAAMQR